MLAHDLQCGSTSGSAQTAAGTRPRCSVHILPTELLREIFTLVVADHKEPTANLLPIVHLGAVNTNIHPPLVLSQTSRRWREIALDMPGLWTAASNISIGLRNMPTRVNRHLFALCLARAKQFPLSVRLLTDTRAATKLALHMNHVRRLELVDFTDPCKLDVLEHPAPGLEYFLLSPTPKSTIVNPQSSMQQHPILFAGHAPSLRALALFGPTFLPRQPFPAWTDLHLGKMYKPRLQDLLELLRGTPMLESLAVVELRISIGLWPFGAQYQPAQAVPLPRLRRLALVRMPLTRGLALLTDLAVPRNAEMHLLEFFADRSTDPLEFPLPPLPPIAAGTALEMIVCGRTLSFRTRVRAVDGSFASVPRARCTAHQSALAYGWWKALWQTLPCAQLTTLRIAVDAEDDEFLPRFLDAAIALASLQLRLQPRNSERRGENVPVHFDGAPAALLGVCALLEQELPVVCPRLEELAVVDASSTVGAWDGFLSGEDASPRVAYVPDVLCVVAARAAAGRGLRRVALQGQWRATQRDRVRSAFAMGAAVTDFEFQELVAESPSLFEFEDDGEERAWMNEHWRYELPRSTLPWVTAGGSGRIR